MSRLLVTLALGLVACTKPAAGSKNPSSDPGAPVATWKGGQITAADLDTATYDQRKQALDQMLVRKLMDQKAKAENLTPEQLYKREVLDKVKPPSDEDVKKFYDETAKKQPLPPFEQIKDRIVQYLQQQNPALQQQQQAFMEGLKKELDAKVLLQPPRVKVAAEGPARGAEKAPVTIVEFSDFQCPYCSRAENTVNQVMKDYQGKVRLVYRDFPLPFHAQAEKAAEAAHCAEDQGKYWEMHEKLFGNQQALEPAALKKYAGELKLDQAKFDKCLDSDAKKDVVAANKKAGDEVGVQGTPAFFINGLRIDGARPYEDFKNLIDQELASK